MLIWGKGEKGREGKTWWITEQEKYLTSVSQFNRKKTKGNVMPEDEEKDHLALSQGEFLIGVVC